MVGGSALAGVAFGTLTSFLNQVSSAYNAVGSSLHGSPLAPLATAARVASVVTGAGWAWAAFAVIVGYVCGRLGLAMVCGAVGLLAASGAYYVTDAVFLQVSGAEFVGETLYWSAASLLFGPPLAVLGWLARRDDAFGLLARLAVPVGALSQMALLRAPFSSRLGISVEEIVANWLVVVAAVIAVLVLIIRHVRRRLAAGPFSVRAG